MHRGWSSTGHAADSLSSTTAPELSEHAALRPRTTCLNRTVTDQWQIAPETSPIVLNTLNNSEIDDSPPMPSVIHRESLALLTSVPSSPILLSSPTLQEITIKEPVSTTPLSTPTQSNTTFILNMNLIQNIFMKAFTPNSDTIRFLSSVHGRQFKWQVRKIPSRHSPCHSSLVPLSSQSILKSPP